MDILERRSTQRRGWLGLGALVTLIALAITILTVSVSLFFAVLIGLLLLAAFTAGSVLLLQQLAAGKDVPLSSGDSRGR